MGLLRPSTRSAPVGTPSHARLGPRSRLPIRIAAAAGCAERICAAGADELCTMPGTTVRLPEHPGDGGFGDVVRRNLSEEAKRSALAISAHFAGTGLQ